MKKTVYIFWGLLYVLCVGFGFIPEPAGLVKWAMVGLSVMFFVPGFLLLYLGERMWVRRISLGSLGITVAVFVLNVLSVRDTAGTGDFLHVLLGLVSAPMFCSQIWVLSWFLWACLLMASLMKHPGTEPAAS
jgi:hypothetical protein